MMECYHRDRSYRSKSWFSCAHPEDEINTMASSLKAVAAAGSSKP
jgi:hypothetical protein